MTTTTEAPPKVRYRTLCGNLTRDPELRFSAKGTPWATCGLAVNRRTRHEDGSWTEEEPEFFELVTFGDTAEHLAECVTKGDRVVATGKLEEDTWTGRNGDQRVTQKLVVDEVGVSLRFATVTVGHVERHTPEPIPADLESGYSDEPF